MAILIIILIIACALGGTYLVFLWPETSQVFGYFPYKIKTDKKLIALTFDDGPNPPHTNKLLEVLSKHGVHATFFAVGKNLERFPELGKAIIAGGHVIGNHSYSHEFSKYFKSLSFKTEIVRTQEVIESITGKKPALFRSPWLFRSPRLLRELKSRGLSPVSGLFSSQREIWQPPARKIADDALKVAAPGVIIIFHDGYDAKGGNRAETVGAVDLLIPELKARGYEFVTVDRILGVSAYQS